MLPRAWAPWTALVVGLVFTAAVTVQLSREIHARDRARFENAINQVADNMNDRLDAYVAMLRAGAGLLDASSDLSLRDFRAFVNRLSLDTRYAGVQGIGYAERYDDQSKATLEQRVRSELGPTFHVWPELNHGDGFAILYLEPLDERNRAAIGYDMYSNQIRHLAMDRARDTASPAASGRVTLVQEIDENKQAGFLVYVPVYAGGVMPTGADQRAALLRGFVYCAFRADDLLSSILKRGQNRIFDLQIFDQQVGPEYLLYRSGQISAANVEDAVFSDTKSIDLAGRRWLLSFNSNAAFDAASDSRKVPMVALIGVLVSLFLFMITLAQARSRAIADDRHRVAEEEVKKRRDAEEQVHLRNDQLQQTVAELQSIQSALQAQNEELASTRQAIERERRRYRDLFEFAPDGQIVTDMKGIVREANHAAARLLNCAPEKINGEPLMSFASELSIAALREAMNEAHTSGRVEDREIEFFPAGGESFDGAVTISLLRDRHGMEIGFQWLLRDITERKSSQAKIQRNAARQASLAQIGRIAMAEENLQTFMDMLVEGVARTLDIEYCKVLRLSANEEFLVMQAGFGWHQGLVGSAVVGADLDSQAGFTLKSDRPVVVEDLRNEHRFHGPPLLIEHGVVSGMSVVIMGEGGRPYGVLGAHTTRQRNFTNEDVVFLQTVAHMLAVAIERHRSEESLRESERQFRAIFELAAVGEAHVDPATGRLRTVNRKLCDITGYAADELQQMTFLQLTHPDDRQVEWEQWRQLVRGEVQELSSETRFIRNDGEIAWVLMSATAVRRHDNQMLRCILVIQDVSEIKKAQRELTEHRGRLEELVASRTQELERTHQQLRLSERMAALGTLSAGLGHDMGNLLLPVRLRLDAIEAKGMDPAIKEDLLAIRKCAEYLQRLVNGLRLFALDPEDSEASSQRTEINEWWSDVQPFLHNALPRQVELLSDFKADIPPLKIAKHLLTQMMFNLVQNAGDALRSCEKGQVRITAQPSQDREFVDLRVADNGPGMPDDVRQRCMEPFFTTKTRGLSTGLGLALVHGIVQKVGGVIDLHTTVGQGTEFIIRLPTHASIHEGDEGPQTPRPLAVLSVSNARTRAYVASVLESLSFDVEVSPSLNGSAATIWIADARPQSIREAQQFVRNRNDRRVILFGALQAEAAIERVIMVEENPKPTVIRKALQEASLAVSGAAAHGNGQS